MTNTDKNLEIAKFCGIDAHILSLTELKRVILGKEEDFNWDSITDFNPDTDWNWLHKAWDKFRDSDLLEIFSKDEYWDIYSEWTSRLNPIQKQITHGTLSEAFEALYEGVNWYNNLKH